MFLWEICYNIVKEIDYPDTSDAAKVRKEFFMDIQSNISNNIKKYRKELCLSQEALAERLGVTSQAVSKWECMLSIPDIDSIIALSELFGITIDKLLLDKDTDIGRRESDREENPDGEGQHFDRRDALGRYYFDALPDDKDLRVLQFVGRKLIRENDYKRDVVIPLAIDDKTIGDGKTVNVHIVGNAHIEGDIGGNVTAGDGVACGNVGMSVQAGDGVACGNVGMSVHAGDGVNCGNVGMSVHAGDGVNCGNVGASVTAGDDVTCGDVHTITNCGGDIHCQRLEGEIKHCDGVVYVG
ncbi:MAG: helix-turn-helix transcriptional regulator [Clostridia bacterium]|nr:helix-turn-helix transcriptional regulator [Clostridia bacterium]